MIATQIIAGRPLTAVAWCALAIAGAGMPGPLMAQVVAGNAAPAPEPDPQGAATDPAAQPDAAATSEIVVTGSRVIADGRRAPTPVTVVSADQLRVASPGPVGEALIQLPVFSGSSRPTTGGFSSTGPNSGSFLNLRNLGAQRTLLLLDGRRIVPSGLSGATDTNLLPQDLISRVDVVTGGASAAYGSDAVSGVVNFVLDTKYKGLKGEVQKGVSTYGDNQTTRVSLSAGTGFAGGRGHVVVSGSWFDGKGVGSTLDRPWGREGRGIISDPAKPGSLLITDGVRTAGMTPGGLIFASPATATAAANALRGIAFGPGGTPQPFNFGVLTTLQTQVGGDGVLQYSNIAAAQEIANLFGHVRYEITDDVEIFAEASWGKTRNRYAQAQQANNPGANPITIFSGNAFLPAAVQATMTANAIPSFSLGRFNSDFGTPATADARNRTINLVAGVSAKLGGTWQFNAYGNYGENIQRIQTQNNIIHERLYAAVDAVRDTSGNVVCRVSVTNPGLYPGCVALNPFGTGSPSAAALDYVLGTAAYRTRVRRSIAAASVTGELLTLPAGPVRVSTGAEYRKDSTNQTSDPISQQFNRAVGIRGFPAGLQLAPGGYQFTNAQPVKGSIEVKEGYVEAAVPVLRDAPFARSFDLNGAIRYADYSNSGGALTWKVGGTLEPVAGIRLRASRSRDIRSPNVAELFAGSIQLFQNVFDPQRQGAQTTALTNTLGNPGLDPEKADTFTGGVVLEPAFLPGALLSVDYYSIDLNGVVSALTAQQTIDQCAAGSTVACANVTRAADGTISRIILPQLNLSSRKVKGLDFEASYRTAVGSGQFTTRAVLTHLIKQETRVPGGSPLDRAGEVGVSSNPDWAGVLSTSYTIDTVGLFVQERFIGRGTYDVTRIDGTTISDNSVPAVFYTDATLRLKPQLANGKFEFDLTVNNLFNKAPPRTPTGVLSLFLPTNAQLYDNIGRQFTVTARMAM